MTEFAIYNAKPEDLSRYPDFFAQAPMFNTLNQVPQIADHDQGIITRMTCRSVEKLVFAGTAPVFFLSYRKSTLINAIETLIWDSRVEADEAALADFIRTECFDKPLLTLGPGKFEHHTCDQPLNERVMLRLGFDRKKNHRVMTLFLDLHQARAVDASILPHIAIHPVVTTHDMHDRVEIQNIVFQNKNRIPLTWMDVQTEMRNHSYQPDLSLLMYYDGIACGYGQIVSNSSSYYLVNFGITGPFQGQGLSHILLDRLLDLAGDLGISFVKLEVFENNVKATSLYESHGFKTMYNKSQWVYSK